jgi:basic membrane protein A
VQSALDAYYAGSFPGGESLIYGADKDGVQLPMETSKFKTFTQADYDAVFGALADGSIMLKNDTDAESATGLGLTIVKITLVD